ncbi:glycosyl transferase [Paenibacillus sp. J45TS6]|uniref:glycosyltransferase n=1 Tax=Paenibacillus sp. J45TS6 TaxID=2807196 RepID=UPI001B0756B1|nr:glycosyltransferase family 2 protein [Paenibacillus sp. J45TS6]GIP42762.1 glycosyl transferase [Paenibacillus sp. J45TS6]
MTYVWIIAGWISGLLMLSGMKPLIQQTKHNQRDRGEKRKVDQLPSVSIIIPARNEEGNLTSLLRSIQEQTALPIEVIVVDDGSVDRTAEIAASFGAKVLDPGELPQGWLGKNHACAKGAEVAKGEIFIFLDADITLSPNGIEILLSRYTEGLLSVQPYHQMMRPYEQWSAFFNVIIPASIGSGKDGTGAFGPCIVCSRDAYKESGGHELVKGEILDHHTLGKCFARLGYQVRNYIGISVLYFRMYPEGWSSLWRGWSKSMASGAAATRFRRLLPVIIWIMGMISSFFLLIDSFFTEDIWIGTVIYALYALEIAVLLRRVGNFRSWVWSFYPLPLLFFLLLFIRSILMTFVKKKVKWKDREIEL